ncbi:MAG: hypothetical protein ACR2QU_07695 [Gammaproteobacteria bacterium]
MVQSTVAQAVATAPSTTMSQETVLKLALEAEPAPDRWEYRFQQLLESGVAIGASAAGEGAQSWGPGDGPAPIVIRKPVDPDSMRMNPYRERKSVADIYFLIDESVLGCVQTGARLTVRLPGDPGTRRVDARDWWIRFIGWMSQQSRVSIAIAGLEERAPTKAFSAMIDPYLGQLTKPGDAAVVLDLDLSRLVNRRGFERTLAAEVVPALVRFADNLLCACNWPSPAHVKNAVTRRLLRINLTRVFPAIDKLGVNPRTYGGLQKVERLIGEVCQLASAYSMALAAERGPCQDTVSPPHRLAGHPFAEPALRNSQLTSLSPYAFLPPDRERHRAYLDLLPAIRLVDNVGWRRPTDLGSMDAADLAVLYRLTWAVRRAT